MDMECLITLDDAVAALHVQLNAPLRRKHYRVRVNRPLKYYCLGLE